MNKPKLAILSDIYGNSKEHWMKEYVRILSPFFEITQLDSRELADIHLLPQSQVHGGFVQGGIERAAQNLISKDIQPKVILGFSVGGTIAWKYALSQSQSSLYLISATRLRNETSKPSSPINLFFGELEKNGPSSSWFKKLELNPEKANPESKILSLLGYRNY